MYVFFSFKLYTLSCKNLIFPQYVNRFSRTLTYLFNYNENIIRKKYLSSNFILFEKRIIIQRRQVMNLFQQ